MRFVKSEAIVSKKFLLSQMPQKATNWPHKTSSMTQEKQLFWKDRWIYPDTLKRNKVPKIMNKSYFQVLDYSCKGIGGALVEVWYAGGNPGLPKSLSTIGVTFHTPWLCYCPGWVHLVTLSLCNIATLLLFQLVTLLPCHIFTLLAEYTFPENNMSGMPASPEVWYRGKVKADDQGRCLQS